MQGFDIHCRFSLWCRRRTERTGRTFQKLIAPLFDLVRMDVKILGQIDQSLLALDRGNSHSIVGKLIPRINF